ncbi:alpha/beta hydrolase [Roseivivax sp. CAU 1753]
MRRHSGVSWVAGLLIGLSVLVADPARAQEADIAGLAWLADNDPALALVRTEAALAEIQADPTPDLRLIFDLSQLKATLLLDLGQRTEAARILADLARFAARHRQVLDIDPVPLLSQAAALYEAEGEFRRAGQILTDRLEEERDGGRPGPVLAATLRDLARLSDLLGRQADAADYRAAAAQAQDNAPTGPSRSDDAGFRAIDVYYATDRARSGDDAPAAFYGSGRGTLELGIATVTIPEVHTPGLVEAPSIWRLEFSPSPARHVMLQSVTPVETDEFYSRLNSEFDGTGKTEAFVFVHGFNVRFDQATKRAAQIAYDMEYDGVPIVYSWPSRGSTISYVADTAVVQLSARRLTGFLDDLVERSGATTIHIVAHSMGNRALTEALELMALRRGVKPGDAPLLGQILFAAPDVDADLFAEMIPTIRPLARRLTLYASESDWALVTSRKLHGDMPRAGQGGDDTLAIPLVDSIDMSELGEDMLAHSYFADDSSALTDMMALFWRNTEPLRRCGLVEDRTTANAVAVWRYRSGRCGGQELIDLMAELRRVNATVPAEVRAVMKRKIEDTDMRTVLEPVVMKLIGQ